uniref:ATP synthase F0 subunit 8 n=1 Tax=Lasioglossum leucopus TaxID=1039738 RepID=A0A0S2LSQ7_9HYME|nr:ATP synthase F0 subunit 8 [Lasioglossum leucopus]
MPQMSPMYWTILLLFTLIIIFIYTSMFYFTLMSPPHMNKTSIKHSPHKMFKIKWY